MDTAKWPQEFVVKPMNEIVTNPPPAPVEKKTRPEKDLALNCPRCNSLNTKFCYYNNYSLTQPRYFCKDCRRYWTQGGSLRNIPIGGGIRKNKRSSSSPSSTSSKKPLFVNNTPPPPPPLPQLNPKLPHDPKLQELGFGHVKDLNLAFSQGFGIAIPEFLPTTIKNNPSLVSTSSALELLGISSSSSTRPPPTFMPTSYPNVHDSYTSSGFGLSYPQHHQFQEFMRPALGFSLDAAGAYGGDPSLHQQQNSSNNGRPLLQFESLKLPVSSSSTNSGNVNDNHHSDHEHDDKDEGDAAADQSAGFWNGMLSAGGAASASASRSWQ